MVEIWRKTEQALLLRRGGLTVGFPVPCSNCVSLHDSCQYVSELGAFIATSLLSFVLIANRGWVTLALLIV